MSAAPKRLATAKTLGDALVATVDHRFSLHLGGNTEREKLQWLASIVAAAHPDIAREIILRWGAPEELPGAS